MAAGARAKKAELNALTNELRGLPDRIGALNVKLATINSQREALDKASLRSELKEAYRLRISADSIAMANKLDADISKLQVVLCSRELRLEVLAEGDKELKSNLAELTKREKELTRILRR